MTTEEAKHKLDFMKKAYQKLIDEKVDSGKLVGDGVRGEWKAEAPLDEAYKDMIGALDMAIKALEQQICDNDCEHCDWVTCPKMEEENETITVSKGCLKARKGRFVVYDVEYLKKHIDREAEIYGRIAGMKKEHDGCVSCRFEDKKEHEEPCRRCSHNFTDKWRAKE